MTTEIYESGHELKAAYRAGRVDRREFIRWSAILGLSVPLLDARRVQAAGVVRGGTLHFAVDPTLTIEPHQLNDDPGIGIVHQVCEMLVDIGADGIPRGRLATSWAPSDGGKVWTVVLRRGVKFHNGQLMTADDVVASFQRLVNPKSGSSAQATFSFLSMNGVRKVDSYTVAFHLKRIVVDFPSYLNTYQAVILPANWPGHFAKNPIGTGPFKMVEFVPQQHVKYVKNSDYWIKGLPYLDGVEAVILSSDNQVTALLGGSVDMANNTAALPLVRANPKIKILTRAGTGHDGIYMRTDMKPFSDKRVRQAVALCMNRPALIKSVWQGLGVVGNDNVMAPSFAQYNPIPQREQNYGKAKALLSAAGYPTGFSTTLTTSSDTAPLVLMATVVQQMLKPAGIQVTLKPEPSSVYFNTDWLQTPLNITNWGNRATASQFLGTAYTSGAVWNASHWSNTTFDTLVKQYDAELDLAKRKALAKQIEMIMTDEVPAIIPFFIKAATFVRTNVQGYLPDAIGFRDLRRTYFSA